MTSIKRSLQALTDSTYEFTVLAGYHLMRILLPSSRSLVKPVRLASLDTLLKSTSSQALLNLKPN
jgi:hypothetical protein